LADPLVMLENEKPFYPLPPFFAPVGGADFWKAIARDCKTRSAKKGFIAKHRCIPESPTHFTPWSGERMPKNAGSIPSAF